MPLRFLRPGLTTSDRWNSVSWQAQSFYIRLLTLVDDYGRYDSRPAILSSHAFPLSVGGMKTEELSKLAKELSEAGLVVFYTHKGKPYLQLSNWQERARSASKFPQFDNTCKQLFTIANNCMLPTPSPSSSPPPSSSPKEGGIKPVNLASDFIIPTDEQEWLAICRNTVPELPEWRCKQEYHYHAPRGWKGITDIYAAARSAMNRWVLDGHPANPPQTVTGKRDQRSVGMVPDPGKADKIAAEVARRNAK